VAEREITGLGISFVLVISVRYYISGHLVPYGTFQEADYSKTDAYTLFIVALLFFLFSSYGLVKGWHEMFDMTTERFSVKNTAFSCLRVLVEVTSMCGCWCFIFATMWLLCANGESAYKNDNTLLFVVLAICMSAFAFTVIFVIDSVADRLSHVGNSHHLVDALREVILMCGVLVGFSWEATFDVAEDALAESSPHPRFTRVVMGLLSVAILIPAWRWHLLPMVHQYGWKFGFVVDNIIRDYGSFVQLEEAVAEHLEEEERKRKERSQFHLPVRKKLSRQLTSTDAMGRKASR